MKFLSPKLHGLGDYAAAVALILGPFLFDVAAQSVIAHWFSIIGGIGLIVYSLFTDYTFSLVGRIPFKVHLLLDIAAGIGFLAVPAVISRSTCGARSEWNGERLLLRYGRGCAARCRSYRFRVGNIARRLAGYRYLEAP
ncbi:MAG: hypothetical protein K0U72_13435 [Gammaproteobacteria bacterium]|nr:hypothetical protein [Gammaproteobacteria bacterium]